MMKSLLSVLAIALLQSSAPHLDAQSYPNQPISLVIPLAPGDAGVSLAARWQMSCQSS